MQIMAVLAPLTPHKQIKQPITISSLVKISHIADDFYLQLSCPGNYYRSNGALLQTQR
jgi:hypothetical protein